MPSGICKRAERKGSARDSAFDFRRRRRPALSRVWSVGEGCQPVKIWKRHFVGSFGSSTSWALVIGSYLVL